MRDISTKTDTVDTLPAADFNANLKDELQNVVESAGFTLDAEGGPDTNLNMLGQAIALYANAGWYYQDSGSANTYQLARVGLLKSVPQSYKDGMLVLFKAVNANTGPSTINVDSIGVKDLTTSAGSALAGGEIIANYVIARYNSAGGRFEIAFSALPGPSPATDSIAGIVELATPAEVRTGTSDNLAVTPEGLHEKIAGTGVPGIVELATIAEVAAGTDTFRAVTPYGLQQKVASTTAKGLVSLASNADTQAGTNTEKAVTPAALQSKVAGTGFPGIVELATIAEVVAGTDTFRAVTPYGLQGKVASTTAKGLVSLASNADTQAGTNTEKAVTPAGLQSKVATTDDEGIVELATGIETRDGTDGDRAVTPSGLQSKVATISAKGIVELATPTETQTGADGDRAVTPSGLQSKIATISDKGIVELATDGETQTGADSARAVTPEGLASFAKSLTTDGYHKFPGGLIIQWGTITAVSAGSSKTASFPIAFPTTCLNAIATRKIDSNANGSNYVATISATQIKVRNSHSSTAMDTMYIAIGY